MMVSGYFCISQALKAYEKIVHDAILDPKVDEVRRGRWFRDKADQILAPVKKTLRPISPRKRKYIIAPD